MRIVCLGDSFTYGYKLARDETWPYLLGRKLNFETINMGISGDTSFGMLARFYRDVIRFKPSHVIITGGANDLNWGVPLPILKSNLASMAFQAMHYGISTFIGIPIPIETEMAKKHWSFLNTFSNNGIRKLFREWIYKLNNDFPCDVVDFFSPMFNEHDAIRSDFDGLHLNANGNLFLTDAIAFQILGNFKK